MEDLARLVDESLARHGIQIPGNNRWLHAETIYGSAHEAEDKTENEELASENWVAHADVA